MSNNSGGVSVIDKNTIKKGLKYAVVISLVISALIVLLTFDKASFERALASINPQFMGVLLFLLLINWLVAGLRIKILVTTVGGNITLLDGIIIYLSGAFVSNVTPFATGGGPFQVYFLHKKGLNVGKASIVVVTQFILRIFFFGILTPLFLIFFRWAISPGIIPDYLFYTAFGFGILFSTIIIIFSLVPGVTDTLLNYLFSIDKVKMFFKNNQRAKRLLVKARQELYDFRRSLSLLAKYKGRLLLAGLCTALYWSTLFMIMPIILGGLNLEPHFFRSYIMQTIYYLVIPYMPTPGASGIAEIGFASLFVSFIPGDLIGLVTCIWRFITFYVVLTVGGIFALREITRSRGQES
ncbi:lysylphosphatidylglycerol synthase transmembrane domain-containing protein [Halothermothrix orenii]|uniref:Phosphatidylglycerol lysyltransferase n=1 Tax=Halothermothrix orenii (strain H 168 / OCM 544 / DSM 9562) TaxID=373903 RepID=B8CWS4_HALOH|nr:lysylphosphatidylglycerol synthase transmembrane domain-containing protein [Halothermothrix orenii]ACL69743.1 conserved hypothetical protein TIGR00374 [Halothermothrix orenii H 168]